MKIFLNIKQAGKRKPFIGTYEMIIPEPHNSLREVIVSVVKIMTEDYNKRAKNENPTAPLGDNEIADMSEIGKIAFGINYGENSADPEKAIESAITGFLDGLYRVFLGEREIAGLDEPLNLKESDTLTFIRLVMLSGRLW